MWRMISVRLVLTASILVFFQVCHSAEPPKRVASVEGITEYQLANGLRILLFPDKSQSKVTANMTVLVGSRQEGYGETGMAHLLEHMVFKGTPRHPQIPKALQEHGAQFNGSTSSDRVNYFETLTATDENLEFALDLEADRLVNSYIKKEDLERLLREGVKPDELAKVRQGYMQAQRVARSSDVALTGLLSNLRHIGRTMAFEAEQEKKIEALTPEQVVTALRAHLDLQKLVAVSAGDFEAKAASTTGE